MCQGTREGRPSTRWDVLLECVGAGLCVQRAWGGVPVCVEDMYILSQTTQERDLGGRCLLTKATIITVNLN